MVLSTSRAFSGFRAGIDHRRAGVGKHARRLEANTGAAPNARERKHHERDQCAIAQAHGRRHVSTLLLKQKTFRFIGYNGTGENRRRGDLDVM
jgi:hypothetical protein